MKKSLMIVCGVLGCLPLVAPAAQPVNEGLFKPDECWILSLSAAQLEEVELRRRLTLSKQQLGALRQSVPRFPKRIGVASVFVDQIADSRFSLWPNQVVGIWYSKDKVAIPRDSLDGDEGYREFNTTLRAGDAVLIDTQGRYSIGSRRVDVVHLHERLDALALMQPEGTTFEIFVLRPPVLAEPSEEAVVQAAIEGLVEACQKRELRCRIGG